MTARRLRIHVGERDKDAAGHVLHETIVHEAHRRGLAGATVFKGVAGFGAHGQVHAAKILRLGDDLPVVVEIVDRAERIDAFVPWLREAVREGLVTVEDVTVVVDGNGRMEG
jgi:hypothetical protein